MLTAEANFADDRHPTCRIFCNKGACSSVMSHDLPVLSRSSVLLPAGERLAYFGHAVWSI